ncbi:unnamed protein product [Parnassius apollo]|uniref:(apollo) hypothetical protein n=1 Tax=Parnassius apollo TaxID=110799 RepID=A0A8S3Y7S5_PARAO|nr:unnamed protein product [Parnassius apollo]
MNYLRKIKKYREENRLIIYTDESYVHSSHELIKEKVNAKGVDEWRNICGKVKQLEDDYRKSDHIEHQITEELFIRVGQDSDSDASDSADTEQDGESVPGSNYEELILGSSDPADPRVFSFDIPGIPPLSNSD